MGIYIKGMSMDNGIYQIENGKLFKYSSKGKPTKQYDVVEIQAPHARLIDSDRYAEALKSLGNRDYRRSAGTIQDALKFLQNAPTIMESEE